MSPVTLHIEQLAQAMPPISLTEMSDVRLMNRVDTKYVTNLSTLEQLLGLARESYYSQEIGGTRVSPYATTYLDDAGHGMFRCHQAGHRPRRKVRIRTYVASDESYLEVKHKDNHGRTTKHRVAVPSLQSVLRDRVGADFVREETDLDIDSLSPVVGNRFNRLTLVNHALTERLTIDFDLSFYDYGTQHTRHMDNVVIIELKRDGRAPSPILPLLRRLRIKPAGFSKYCIGVSVTTPGVRPGVFKKRLIRLRKVSEGACDVLVATPDTRVTPS